MQDRNYNQITEDIQNWNGFETDYWKAVEICQYSQKLTATELIILKAGLSVKSKEIIDRIFEQLKNEALEFNKNVAVRNEKAAKLKSEAKIIKTT